METITAKKVTVIIPTYNRTNLLERAIKSVYEQTYRPIELIVMNNASTVDTDSIIGKFKNPTDDLELIYIKRNTNNRDEARNEAIERASGDYICFLDDDDEFMKDKILKQVEHFQGNPGIDVSFTNNFLENKGITTVFLNFKDEGLIAHDSDNVAHRLCKGPFLFPVNLMIKASVIKKERFNTTLYSHEDYELMLRLIHGYKFDWVDEPLSIVHSHESNERYDTIQTKVDQANILLSYASKFPQYFREIALKLGRLKKYIVESYTSTDQTTKARQFVAEFKRKSAKIFDDYSLWLKQTNPPIIRYFKLIWLAALKNKIGFAK